jgi:hypothetical protein
MKYRIQKKGNWFIPQYRYDWFPYWSTMQKMVKISGEVDFIDEEFLEFDSAFDLIEDVKRFRIEEKIKAKVKKPKKIYYL